MPFTTINSTSLAIKPWRAGDPPASAGIVASGDANSGLERTFEAGDGVSLAVVDFGHLVHQPIWVARRSLASQVDMVSTMYVPLSVMRSTAAWST